MKSESYYRIIADPKATDRWYLGVPIDSSGREVDPRLFTQGVEVDRRGPFRVSMRKSGLQVDFNFADFDMPVVTRGLALTLEKWSGSSIQIFEADVDGASDGDYCIVNTLDLVDCINESSSQYLKWTSADGRPEKIGQYRMFTKICIDSSRAHGHHFFRVCGWPITLIVSSELRAELEALGVRGISFLKVS